MRRTAAEKGRSRKTPLCGLDERETSSTETKNERKKKKRQHKLQARRLNGTLFSFSTIDERQ